MPSIGTLLTKSREKAGLTREEAAASMDFVSVRTLAAYERDEYQAPTDTIGLIAKAYNDKALLFKCLQECPVWKELFPAINFDHMDLRGAACRLPKKLSAVQRHIEDILDMASDDELQPEELPEWSQHETDIVNLLINLVELLAAAARF